MNIFHLDFNPRKTAQAHCDKHVVKMIVESCQMLSTACHVFGLNVDGLYKKTHVNHPCSLWVRESKQNFEYLLNLTIELLEEYTYRYEKVHASSSRVLLLIDQLENIPLGKNKLTDFVAVVPGNIYFTNAVTHYRNLYNNEKRHMITYTKRKPPTWLKELK